MLSHLRFALNRAPQAFVNQLRYSATANLQRTCQRIVAYDKSLGEYIRCGMTYTDATNSDTACQFHEMYALSLAHSYRCSR
eukprot:m.17875 g.17875  ORF g.17875 m.17875 type:complete len:81 (-) comp10707_c0_seq6:510-752(-)